MVFDEDISLVSLKSPAHNAALHGDLKDLQAYVAGQGTNHELEVLSDREEQLGRTPMHLACEHGHLHVVEYLVHKKVDLSCPDHNKVTPLHLAASRNHFDIVRLLLREGAYVHAKDLQGELAIHWAASKGNSEVIRLLAMSTGVCVAGPSGWTPLHRAAHGGHALAVDALLQIGAFHGCRNKDGDTALHLACAAHQLAVMEVLLAHGSSLDVVNEHGKTPLCLCSSAETRQLCADDRWRQQREKLQLELEQEQEVERQKQRQQPKQGHSAVPTLFRMLSLKARKCQEEDATFPDTEHDSEQQVPPHLSVAPRHRSMTERRKSGGFLETCLEPVSELRQARSWHQSHMNKVLDEMAAAEVEEAAKEDGPRRHSHSQTPLPGQTLRTSTSMSMRGRPTDGLPLIRRASMGNCSRTSISPAISDNKGGAAASPLPAPGPGRDSPAPASERKICAYLNLSNRLRASSPDPGEGPAAAAEVVAVEDDGLVAKARQLQRAQQREWELLQVQEKEWEQERREKERVREKKDQAIEKERRHQERERLKKQQGEKEREREREKEKDREREQQLKEQSKERELIREQHRAWEKEAEKKWEGKGAEGRRKSAGPESLDSSVLFSPDPRAHSMRRSSVVCLIPSTRRPSMRVSFAERCDAPLHTALSSPGDASFAPAAALLDGRTCSMSALPTNSRRGSWDAEPRPSSSSATKGPVVPPSDSLWSTPAAAKSLAATVASMHSAPTLSLSSATSLASSSSHLALQLSAPGDLQAPEPPSCAPTYPTAPRPGRHLVPLALPANSQRL